MGSWSDVGLIPPITSKPTDLNFIRFSRHVSCYSVFCFSLTIHLQCQHCQILCCDFKTSFREQRKENTPCGRTGAKTSAANSSNMTGSLCCLAIDSTYLALSSKLNTLLKIKPSSSHSYKLILLIFLSRI